jgi:ribosome recycling factor
MREILNSANKELKNLLKEEEEMDDMISLMKTELQTLSNQEDYSLYGYLTYEDIRKL